MRKLCFSIAVVVILWIGGVAHGASHYMSPTGTDSGSCTQSAPCATFAYAFKQMAGGDTLYLANGTYTGSGNVISDQNEPPSGTSTSAMTTIVAQNIPCQNGVACNKPLLVTVGQGNGTECSTGGGLCYMNASHVNYIKIQGIYFRGMVQLMGTGAYDNTGGGKYWYFKQCAAEGDVDGNNTTWSLSSNPYGLLEDCIGFGKGRYKFLFYDQDRAGTPLYNVCRRCISRMDYDNDPGDPIAGFAVYYAHNTALLNCIDIDGNLPTYWATDELSGSFTQQVDDSSNIAMNVQGSIALSTAYPVGYSQHAGVGGITFTDVAGIKAASGIYGGGISNNRVTLVNMNTANFTYSSGEIANLDDANNGFDYYSSGSPSQTLTNSIAATIPSGSAAMGGWAASYLDYYGTGGLSGTAVSNAITTSPFTNGLLYPIRIESGSTLATAGSGGGQVGANITQTLGADGTFYGSTGYNTATGTSLWPWPLEAWVQAQMAAMDTTITGSTMPSPTRGFCATGNGLYGGPITLTSYIWESLGNALPSSVYGGSQTVLPAPTNLHIVTQ